MDAIADLHRRAHLIEAALDDVDQEEQMTGADLAVIERETLGKLLTQIEEWFFLIAA